MDFGNTFSQSKISLVVADPMAITAELLREAFATQSGFEVLGCPGNLDDLVKTLTSKQPDVVIIRSSSTKKGFSTQAILTEINNLCPQARSIVLSSDLTKENVISYFHAQARGILPADNTDFATLCKSITSVYQGQIWASSEHLNYLIESLSGWQLPAMTNERGEAILSAREQEVLGLLSQGMSNREMAMALKLSEHTIKNHLFHIFEKLGVSSRTEAILYATRSSSFRLNGFKHAEPVAR